MLLAPSVGSAPRAAAAAAAALPAVVVRQQETTSYRAAQGREVTVTVVRVVRICAYAVRQDTYSADGAELYDSIVDDSRARRHIVINWRRRQYYSEPLPKGLTHSPSPGASAVTRTGQFKKICGLFCEEVLAGYIGPSAGRSLAAGAVTEWVTHEPFATVHFHGFSDLAVDSGLVLQSSMRNGSYSERMTTLSVATSQLKPSELAPPVALGRADALTDLEPLIPGTPSK